MFKSKLHKVLENFVLHLNLKYYFIFSIFICCVHIMPKAYYIIYRGARLFKISSKMVQTTEKKRIKILEMRSKGKTLKQIANRHK